MSDVLSSITSLSADDIRGLVELGERVTTVVQTVQGTLRGVLDDPNGSDHALGALFASLGQLGEELGEAPDFASLIEPLERVLGELPRDSLADVTRIMASIEEVIDFFGPVGAKLLAGDFESGFQYALDHGIEAITRLVDQVGDGTEVLGELSTFFELFEDFVSWPTSAPSTDRVVEFLSRAFVGVSPDVLGGVERAFESALAPLRNLVPQIPEMGLLRDLPASLTAFWANLEARLQDPANVDWPSLEAELTTMRSTLLAARSARDRLQQVVLSEWSSFSLSGLESATRAFDAIPKIQPVKLEPILDGFRKQMRSIVETLEDWAPTEEELREVARRFADQAIEYAERSPLGDLKRMVVQFQQQLMDAVEDLPLRGLARELEALLARVAREIESLDPETIRRPVREFFGRIEAGLEDLSAGDLAGAITDLWSQVESALGQVRDLVTTARGTIDSITGELQSFTEGLAPQLDRIREIVTGLGDKLEALDLNEAGDLVVQSLGEIRDIVADLDLSMLPDAAVGLVKEGAEMLRRIDLTGEIREPLQDALSKIDPTPLLEELSGTLESFVDELKVLDPSSLVAELDAPFDELLRTFDNFGPARLREWILEALEPVKEVLRGIDVAPLLAPIVRIHGELRAQLSRVLDPALIFDPLESVFQPVVDIVEGIDPRRMLSFLEGNTEAFGGLKDAAGPSGPMRSAGSVLRDQLTSAVDAEDRLFGYRPGDLLVPLIDLHARLVSGLDALDDAVLGPAAERLEQQLVGRFQELRPDRVFARLEESVDQLASLLDRRSASVALDGAVVAYRSATLRIAAASRVELSAGDREVAVRVTAGIGDLDPGTTLPFGAASDDFFQAAIELRGGVDLSALRAKLRAFGPRYREIIPSFLRPGSRTGPLDAAGLRQALAALDPAPIRDEVNELFDRVGVRLAGLGGAIVGALDEILIKAEEFIAPLSPGALFGLIQQLYEAVKEQIFAFRPSVFRDEVRAIFDSVLGLLDFADPSFLADEVGALRDQLIATLDAFVESLVPDLAGYQALVAELASFKPSAILSGLGEALRPFTDLVDLLKPATLLDPLIEAIARIREQIPELIARLEVAFDEVLAAFPEGGASSASVSASATVGTS